MTHDDECSEDDNVTFLPRRQYQQQYRADDNDDDDDDDNDDDNNSENDDENDATRELQTAQDASKDDFASLTAFLDQEPLHTGRGCILPQEHIMTIGCSHNSFPQNDNSDFNDAHIDNQEHINGKGLEGVDVKPKVDDRSLFDIAVIRQAKVMKKSNTTNIRTVTTRTKFSAKLMMDFTESRKRSHTTFADGMRIDPSAESTSIVDSQLSRPMHWEGSLIKRITPTATSAVTAILTSKANSTATATGSNWSQTSRTIGSNRHNDVSVRARKLSDATKWSMLAPAKSAKTVMRTPLSSSTGGKVTFAPAFLGHCKHDETSANDPTHSNDDNPRAMSCLNLLQATPRPRIVAGPLLQTLRNVRMSVNGDVVRLQSGMYPPERKDRNDPRQRASLHMILSIVGALFPWRNEEKVIALARMHTNEEGDTNKSLAYVTFTHATARTLSLTPGSTVCIYNPIVLPGEKVGDPSIVIATQLCEPVHCQSRTTTTVPVQSSSQHEHEEIGNK